MSKQKCKYFKRCHHKTGWCNSDTAMSHCTYAIPFFEEERNHLEQQVKELEQQMEEIRTTRVKLFYRNHEYTMAEICERMAELEDMLEKARVRKD